MAVTEAVAEEWESFFQGQKVFGAYGPRDVLILVSRESLQGEDIVPRKEGCLTKKDQERLKNQGIPEECWGSDASLTEARYRREEDRFEIRVLGLDEELKTERVKGEIRALMNNTTKPGVGLYYIGPGKKNTGDWCFKDGFIQFSDIIEAYMENFHAKGKCLEINSDCSYSGKWVIALQEFLDGVGVQPCGHSGRKAGFLLAVATSCRSHEIPYTMLYSARAKGNDKNTGVCYTEGSGFEVEQGQHIKKANSTRIACKKGVTIDDPCCLPESYTWHKKSEAERVFLVRAKNKGKPAWHYVLVVDDEEIVDLFEKKVKSGNIDLTDYGDVLKSGWGKDPPDEVREWIRKKFGIGT